MLAGLILKRVGENRGPELDDWNDGNGFEGVELLVEKAGLCLKDN